MGRDYYYKHFYMALKSFFGYGPPLPAIYSSRFPNFTSMLIKYKKKNVLKRVKGKWNDIKGII